MSQIRANLRYAASHEWVDFQPDTGIATVGITDHAQNELGDVVYLELPAVGRVVAAGEASAVIESVKAASDIYAPVGGEVIEVNEAAAADTGLVNQAPYEAGWLFKLKLADSAVISSLMTSDQYQSHLGE
jgi:glycine cleavage system H protein